MTATVTHFSGRLPIDATINRKAQNENVVAQLGEDSIIDTPTDDTTGGDRFSFDVDEHHVYK